MSDRERAVFAHWRAVVEAIPGGLSRRLAFERTAPLRPESVLAGYVNGAGLQAREHPPTRVFPIPFNLSQRHAVERALTQRVSLVEGGPGMGKTQTIVHLVANLLTRPGTHVAVIAADGSGLDDFAERMDEIGAGFVMSRLGVAEVRAEFFASQGESNRQLEEFLAGERSGAEETSAARLAEIDARLMQAQLAERRRAELHAELAACEQETARFAEYVRTGRDPVLSELPRLAAAAPAIAESALLVDSRAVKASRFSLVPRFNRDSVAVTMDSSAATAQERAQLLLRLQGEFYGRRREELGTQLAEAARTVEAMDAPALVDEHLALSRSAFAGALHARFAGARRPEYAATSYWKDFGAFLRDYPVLTSTAGAFSESLSRGVELETVIVDGAAQIDLVTAATLLASTKHLVVVSDGEPFTPAAADLAAVAAAPKASVGPYDVGRYGLASSLRGVYGEALPQTLLRVD